MRKALLACTAILVATPAWAADEATAQKPESSQSGPELATGAASAATAAQANPAPGSAEERDMLLQEIRSLRDRVGALENRASQVQYSPEMPQRHKLAGEHNFELYGFLQLDAIQDFKRVNPDWDATLRPSRIPTTEGEFGSDGQTLFSVRQSRLGAKANGMLAGKPYEAKFEFDLFGTGVDAGQTTFRVRHMYGSWGPILVGQTNTTWMDADLFPNVVDYWGPPGMVFVRNPQIRFTFLNSNGWKAAVALENPSDDIDPGAIRLIDPELGSNIRNDEELPDLTAMVRYGGDWGHVQLGGILRKVGFDTVGTEDNEPEGSETGWGVSLSGSAKLSLATFRLGIVHGRGIATYMNDGGMDLAPSAALGVVPPIEPPDPDFLATLLSATAVKLTGISAYVDLQWTKQLSSALGYSFTKVDNTNFQEGSAFHKGSYASGNLLWMPADRILAGVELMWGKREDNDGDDGTDLRLQTTFKFNFSSKDIWD
ncbi:porin [Sphingomonas sp. NSE70-1]|uniref:Porin n=1 Tax=Sphingomonas caseinilyticus TaxID=2908205 RepID=A0ABT0RTQ3_9SPHN|nr:DcaP family trimeric outer membrane transporter [Sphingomonas caseinilyticus]MCL6698301.1 porin [Sphingomonas caseinilyticus]